MNQEKTRNFGPQDPFFMEKQQSEKSLGTIIPPPLGLSSKQNTDATPAESFSADTKVATGCKLLCSSKDASSFYFSNRYLSSSECNSSCSSMTVTTNMKYKIKSDIKTGGQIGKPKNCLVSSQGFTQIDELNLRMPNENFTATFYQQ